MESYAQITLRDETTKLFHESPNIEKLLKKHAVDTIRNNPHILRRAARDEGLDSFNVEDYVDKLIATKFRDDLNLLETINNSKSFQDEYKVAWKAYQSDECPNQILREPVAVKLREAYGKLLTEDIRSEGGLNVWMLDDEPGIHKFRVRFQDDILADLYLERLSLQRKIDMFCVGEVRAKAVDFESYLKEQDIIKKSEDYLARDLEEGEQRVEDIIEVDIETAIISDASKVVSGAADKAEVIIENDVIDITDIGRQEVNAVERSLEEGSSL